MPNTNARAVHVHSAGRGHQARPGETAFPPRPWPRRLIAVPACAEGPRALARAAREVVRRYDVPTQGLRRAGRVVLGVVGAADDAHVTAAAGQAAGAAAGARRRHLQGRRDAARRGAGRRGRARRRRAARWAWRGGPRY